MSIAAAAQRIDALEAAVKDVAELHRPVGEYVLRCQVCGHGPWPCNTRRALALVTQEES